MSASGYKRTCGEVRQRVRFAPESGHSEAQERFGLKKRTLDVCFAPESGHKWVGRGMSAYDPKRTSPAQSRFRRTSGTDPPRRRMGPARFVVFLFRHYEFRLPVALSQPFFLTGQEKAVTVEIRGLAFKGGRV